MKSFCLAMCWELDTTYCPCDVHLTQYLDETRAENSTIFHFGSGAHHLVGLWAARGTRSNVVLGITFSSREAEAHRRLAAEEPHLGRSYQLLFQDIYQLQPRLLPEFDVVTLFHLCEFRSEEDDALGGLTDLGVAELLVDRLRPGGRLIFYKYSAAFPKAMAVIAELERTRAVQKDGEFASLLIYRKTIGA